VGDVIRSPVDPVYPPAGEIYHRVLGWKTLGDKVGNSSRKPVRRRFRRRSRRVATLIYYVRDKPQPVYISAARLSDDALRDVAALSASAPEPILRSSNAVPTLSAIMPASNFVGRSCRNRAAFARTTPHTVSPGKRGPPRRCALR